MMKVLRKQDGNAALMACVVILCSLLVFTAISEYLRLQIIAKGVRNAVQSSVISVAIENYDEVYNGLREGYSGGYSLDSNDAWKSSVDSGSVLVNLSNVLNLIDGSKYIGSNLEYTISNVEVNVINASFAPHNKTSKFEAEVFINLLVPLSFGWDHLKPLEIRMKVNAGYTPKF